ncbi:MAG: hypothetical protein O3A95_03050 [Planctomycetota bacterium]|nr:hypothetical protein [Planctomycetota bacterium]MDA1113258.1 hypothetical protein [Planctomycetota bacterium]
MSEPVKVTFKARYIAYGILYLAFVTGISMLTIEKAFSRSQELANYQIDKTRRFMGEEKAQEMSDYIHGKNQNVEEAPAQDAEASVESEVEE